MKKIKVKLVLYLLFFAIIAIALSYFSIILITENHFLESIEKITIDFLMILVLISISLTLFVTKIVDKIVSKPLEALLNEFKKISNHDYSTEIDKELMNKSDEFSCISEALTSMKESLNQYQIELENQNELYRISEKNLKEVMEYNQAMINGFPQLIFIFNREGYCLDCKGRQLFVSKTSNSYIGKHLSEIIKSEDVQHLLEILKKIKENECINNIQLSYEVEGNREYFIGNLSFCRENEIMFLPNRVTELHIQLNRVRYLSYHDQDTDLGNRRHYEQLISELIDKGDFPISIILSDINGLKLINDSFGQKEGDNLILKYVEILKNTVLTKNIFRVGGDEFSIVLPNTTEKDAKLIINEITEKTSEVFTNGIGMSVSFGLGIMENREKNINEIQKFAEDGMYQQKLYASTSRKDNTIEIINNTLQAKNPREQLHSNRVAELCEKMAKALGWSIHEQSKLKTAGLLHDIGKIGIPEELLNKPGRLTEEEYKEICKHPEIGYRILQSSGNMKEISDCILSHHERWDGKGYPRGISGEEISVEARIIAIADTYDAMTSERSYRVGLPKEVAIEELLRCKGTQFEPSLVDVFVGQVLKEDI